MRSVKLRNLKIKTEAVNELEQICFYIFLAIIAITTVIYGFIIKAPFQFDDIANITKNFNIRHTDAWGSIMRQTRWFGELTNKLNFQIGAFEPLYYRLFNLLSHMLAGLSGFGLLYLLCSWSKNTTSAFIRTNAFSLSAISFALFMLHPVQTQTVSYIIQARLEGLASMLVIASLFFFSYFLMLEEKISWKGIASFAAALLALFLACGSKEIAIVTPLLALLIDLFWIADFSWKSLKSRLPYHLLYFTVTMIIMIQLLKPSFFKQVFSFSMTTLNNRGNIITHNPAEKISSYAFLISEFRVLLHYLWIFIFPFNLCVEYDFVLNKSFLSPSVLCSFLTIVGISLAFLAVGTNRNLRPITFGYLWFLLAIAPRSTIIPSAELACDYKTYLASLGIFWIIGYSLCLFFASSYATKTFSSPVKSRNYLVVGLLTLCALLTFQRNQVWADPVAFWADIVKKNPNKARPLNNFGVALTEQGKYDEAIDKYKKAIALDPYYPDPLSNIAVVYSVKEEFPKAITALCRALEIIPDYPEAYNNLAALYVKTKDVDKAIPLLKKAIELRSFYGKAHFNLGRCYLEKEDTQTAWECFKNATQGDLDTGEGFSVLGQVSLMVKKYDEAINAFTQAILKGENSFEVHFNLANAYYLDKNFAEAEFNYRKMLQQNSSDVRVHYNLGEALFAQGKYVEAHELFSVFKNNAKELPQAIFRVAHCREKIYGLADALAFLEEYKAADLGDAGREMLKNELGRLRLQLRINSGNGTVNMEDMKEMFTV